MYGFVHKQINAKYNSSISSSRTYVSSCLDSFTYTLPLQCKCKGINSAFIINCYVTAKNKKNSTKLWATKANDKRCNRGDKNTSRTASALCHGDDLIQGQKKKIAKTRRCWLGSICAHEAQTDARKHTKASKNTEREGEDEQIIISVNNGLCSCLFFFPFGASSIKWNTLGCRCVCVRGENGETPTWRDFYWSSLSCHFISLWITVQTTLCLCGGC